MMNASKNKVTIMLMIISLALLVVLQFLWLKDSYEKAYFDLSRESSMIFRSTVFNLRDSLFVQNIEAVHNDTIPPPELRHRRDSFNVKYSKKDTVADVRIFISSGEPLDTSLNFLKPLASSMHRLDKRRNFVIRMGPDTLSLDTLMSHYRKSLAKASIKLPFKVRHIQIHEKMEPGQRGVHFLGRWLNDNEPQNHPFTDTLFTAQVQLNPMNAYAAIFPKIRAALLKEITPQILFSVLLTSAILTSFVMMFRSLRTQELLNTTKNDFINNVTHELKTPVATVSVALEALKDFDVLKSPERTAEYINIAQNELSRLTLMTDKILKTSSFEANGVTFITEKINLDTIVRKVLVTLQLTFEKQNARVSYTPLGSNFDFMGSEIHFTNVVYNLLDNALKYGGVKNSVIDIALIGSKGSVELTVRDSGIGIPKEYQKKVFEKFFRVPSGDVHNVKGYGLGLNYVASVIKKFEGKVEVESDPGQGSLFKITLPRQRSVTAHNG
jgi:two-component system, OmpR family, phosphate regulon sensor histidine kinase PhoR